METQPTSASTASPTRSASTTNDTSSTKSDFDVFLQMMTAQARYQDPLDPIDSTEYASQLAQFSMVEQQVGTNDFLTALFNRMNLSGFAGLAGWVGMEARAVAPVEFTGSAVTVIPYPNENADDAYLVATDVDGAVVTREQIPLGNTPIEWQGLQQDGTPVPHGTYSLSVENRQEGQVIGTSSAEIYGRVIKTQMLNGEIVLVLAGGHMVLSDFVTGIREPPP